MCGHLFAQTPELHITTKTTTSEREKITVGLLKEILKEHDLTKWIFTKKVIVERGVIPHSHPVLTIGASSDNKDYILATFIHEQLHWYIEKDPESVKKAVAEFKSRYPSVPFNNRAGAMDEHSTYVHLIVCYLEYRSMATLIGEENAKQLMWNQDHYTWVYNTIIEDAAFIGEVLRKNNFNLVE